MKDFSEIISNIRYNRDLSQSKMAEIVGVSESTYMRLESGKSLPYIDTLLKFSESLNVSTDYLLGKVDEPNVEPTKFVNDLGFLHKTKNGFACSAEHCEWRKDGYCPGKGCMKEAVRA